MRTDEHAFEGAFNSQIEIALRASRGVELHGRRKIGVRNRASIRPAHERGNDFLRAGGFFRRGAGTADEDAAPGRRVTRAGGIVRTRYRDARDGGQRSARSSRRAQKRFGKGLTALDEGNVDGSRPGFYGGPKLLFRSGRRIFIVTPAACEAHQALPLAIDADFEFVRITLQPCERNLKLVFAIEREITVDRQTAPGAERQFFLAALLRLADGCLVDVHKHAHIRDRPPQAR